MSGFIDAQINAVVAEIEKANPVDLSSIEEFYASLVAESDRGKEAAARLACVPGVDSHAELAQSPPDFDALSRGEACDGLAVREMP